MCNSRVRLAIAGAGGRMGRQLIQNILQVENVILGAALERKDSSLLGNDVGKLVGMNETGIIVQSSLNAVKNDFDIFIDFTHPEGTLNHLSFCRQNGKAMVIGTTGFIKKNKQVILESSKDIAIVFSVNFSIGINIMLILLEKISKLIGSDTDIEIIESHHRNKVDIPSGTSLAMGKVIAKAMNKDLKECFICLCKKHKRSFKERPSSNISFSSIRAGDIIGEHTAMFIDTGEQIKISHKASSRSIFSNGAIKSAIWLQGKKSGLFNMRDVLNIK